MLLALKVAVCRVADIAARCIDALYLVRDFSANKVIGAKPMDHCATRGVERRDHPLE